VEGGETIQAIVFSIILCSTFFTTILTYLVDKTWLSKLYHWTFWLLGLGKKSVTVAEEPSAVTPEEETPHT
jgi:hypothetical protein